MHLYITFENSSRALRNVSRFVLHLILFFFFCIHSSRYITRYVVHLSTIWLAAWASSGPVLMGVFFLFSYNTVVQVPLCCRCCCTFVPNKPTRADVIIYSVFLLNHFFYLKEKKEKEEDVCVLVFLDVQQKTDILMPFSICTIYRLYACIYSYNGQMAVHCNQRANI